MKKNLFFSKKIKFNYLTFFLLLIFLLLIYLILFLININKPYIIINNVVPNYFIIPLDKEGKKIDYVNKKSINNLSISENINLKKIEDLNFTIQIFSDTNYNKIKNYYNNFLKLKSQLINLKDLFIFSIESDIGVDYFISYKNFLTNEEALNFCLKSNIVQNCIIINPQD
tara:strand:- start:785 stop:1294 length:510 start_codon:yes stop_codon:yes gene_type:complete